MPPHYQSLSVPQAPPYPGAPPTGPSTGSRSGSKKWLVVGAVAAALALVLGIGVAVAVTSGDDDPQADPVPSEPADPTAPTTVETSDPTASEPTAPEPSAGPVTPDLSGAITGDIDGDGKGDLSLLTLDGLRVYPSDGTTFGDPVVRRNRAGLVGVSGDIDNDGRLDLVRVLGNPPRMTASTSVGGAPVSPLATPVTPDIISALDVPIALGDVDGDGNLDLVALTELSPTKAEVDVALGDGTGAFAAVEPWYSGPLDEPEGAIFVADVDDDGLADVVHVSVGRTTDSGPQATLLKSDGSALAVTGSVTPVDTGGFAVGTVLVGDPDGDGVDNILGTTADGLKLNVWSWNGSTFDQTPWYDNTDSFEDTGVTTSGFTVSDVNGDGFDDIVIEGAIDRDFEPVVKEVFLSDGLAFTLTTGWERPLKIEVGNSFSLLSAVSQQSV